MTDTKRSHHLVFRQITTAVNERTAIAAILPGHAAIGGAASEIELDTEHWMRTGRIKAVTKKTNPNQQEFDF